MSTPHLRVSLNWSALEALELRQHQPRPVGYRTQIERVGDGYLLRHHDSVIGLIRADAVAVSSNASHARTTAQRMNTALYDNGIPWMVRHRARGIELTVGRFGQIGQVIAAGLHRASFVRDGDTWAIEDIDADLGGTR